MDQALYTLERIKTDFNHEIYWISSDLALSYDQVFKFPFRNLKTIRTGIKNYILTVEKIPDTADVHEDDDAFDAMLAFWQAKEEDYKRILYWYAAISMSYNKKQQTSLDNWRLIFHWWSNFPNYRCKHIHQARFDAIMQLAQTQVVMPYNKFSATEDIIERKWVEHPKARSDWDEWLWDHFFEEAGLSPLTWVSNRYTTILMRNFGKNNLHYLSLDEHRLLYYEAIEMAQVRSKSTFNDLALYENLSPLPQALDISDMPDFDKYKRDW